jgi:hypothetical protein
MRLSLRPFNVVTAFFHFETKSLDTPHQNNQTQEHMNI